jgi:hypothetical protein
MIVQTIEIVAGVLLVLLALRDVFDTVVVPGESRGALRVARRLLAIMLPIWKWTRRGKRGVDQLRARDPFGLLSHLDGASAAGFQSHRACIRRLVLAAGRFRAGAIHCRKRYAPWD